MVSKSVCFSLVVFAVLVMTTAAKRFSEEDRGTVATLKGIIDNLDHRYRPELQ